MGLRVQGIPGQWNPQGKVPSVAEANTHLELFPKTLNSSGSGFRVN